MVSHPQLLLIRGGGGCDGVPALLLLAVVGLLAGDPLVVHHVGRGPGRACG